MMHKKVEIIVTAVDTSRCAKYNTFSKGQQLMGSNMHIIYDVEEMTETARGWLAAGSVGFIPTLGHLHTGHAMLARSSLLTCELSVVSILVNPVQFGFDEDQAHYPYSLEGDLQLLDQEQVDVVFIPRPEEFYPAGFSFHVTPSGPLAERFEGAARPRYARSTATAMTKLFQLVRPDVVFLGQKNAQQVALIRKLVRDLNIDVSLRVLPTVRERDGLAISARNHLLSPPERKAVPILYRALLACKALIEKGERRRAVIEKAMTAMIATEPLVKLDYVALCDPDTFELMGKKMPPKLPDLLLAVAARVGTTRQVDNILWKSDGYWLT
jgi:pantoate--beta-alanine ligase